MFLTRLVPAKMCNNLYKQVESRVQSRFAVRISIFCIFTVHRKNFFCFYRSEPFVEKEESFQYTKAGNIPENIKLFGYKMKKLPKMVLIHTFFQVIWKVRPKRFNPKKMAKSNKLWMKKQHTMILMYRWWKFTNTAITDGGVNVFILIYTMRTKWYRGLTEYSRTYGHLYTTDKSKQHTNIFVQRSFFY